MISEDSESVQQAEPDRAGFELGLEDLEIRIGKKLRDHRLAKNLSLSEVAKLAEVSVGHLSQIERGLAAPSVRTFCVLSKILGIGAFECTQKLMEIGADQHNHDHHDHDHHAEEPDHEHDPSVSSVGIAVDGAVNLMAFHRWISELRSAQADNLYRMKGVLAVANEDQRYVLQGVHSLVEFRASTAWGSEPRSSKIVFIGRDLDRAALNQGFAACLAG